MVPPKKKSKRQSVRLRHKIEKRGNEKRRKERKDAKKHPERHHKPKAPKLGIPNSYPYKDRLLGEIEEGRRLKKEEAARRKKENRNGGNNAGAVEGDAMEIAEDGVGNGYIMDDLSSDDNEGDAMSALLVAAQARAAEFEAEHGNSSGDSDGDESDSEIGYAAEGKDTSRKQFDKMFKQVVDAADVILYVLDARDPESTRSREIERQIMAAERGEKRLILILNKIDLVPPTVLKGWLAYLRRYFPTLPLKASNGAPNAQSFDHKSMSVMGTSAALLKALKSFAHSRQLKRSVTVGVIGYPNVGKSSVINVLTSRLGRSETSCPTGSEAGVTRNLREVKLDKKLKLLDSPGIVFPDEKKKDGNTSEEARLILLNAIPPKQITDPISAVSLLLERFSVSPMLVQKLLDVYNCPPLADGPVGNVTKGFLIEVARKRGRLGKGGIPNLESAAMAVVMDWRDGRIQGWVDPPEGAEGGEGIKNNLEIEKDQKELVGQWLGEFDLASLGDETVDGDIPMHE